MGGRVSGREHQWCDDPHLRGEWRHRTNSTLPLSPQTTECVLGGATAQAIAENGIDQPTIPERSMKMDGNTILITGGGSGIGRGLAEAFHHRGNQVIITGRGLSRLKAVCEANPGMLAVELDVRDPAAVKRVAAQMIARSEEHTSELQSHHDLVCR